jgi:hypothetical protein
MAFTHSFNINDWETLRAWRRGREEGMEGGIKGWGEG